MLADRRKLTPFIIMKMNLLEEKLVLELFVNVMGRVGRTEHEELVCRREKCWLLILPSAT